MGVTPVGSHFIGRIESLPTDSARSWVRDVFVLHVIGDVLYILMTVRTLARFVAELAWNLSYQSFIVMTWETDFFSFLCKFETRGWQACFCSSTFWRSEGKETLQDSGDLQRVSWGLIQWTWNILDTRHHQSLVIETDLRRRALPNTEKLYILVNNKVWKPRVANRKVGLTNGWNYLCCYSQLKIQQKLLYQ